MAYTLHNATIASTYDRLFTRNTTVPSTGATATGLVAMNDSGVDIVLPLHISTERVGIGTASPGALLEVRGSTGTDFSSAGELRLSTAEVTVITGDVLGMITFQAPLEGSGSDSILPAAAIWCEAAPSSNFDADENDGDIVFATANSETAIATAQERMRIDSEGNVGIGETNPDYKLAINLVGSERVKLHGNASSPDFHIHNQGGSGSGKYSIELQGSNFGSNYLQIGRDDGGHDVVLMGDVGIGTSSPDKLLHLGGEQTAIVRLDNPASAVGANHVIGALEFEQSVDASGAGVGIKGAIRCKSAGSIGEDAYLTFYTASSVTNDIERMRIDEDGNVGIGIEPSYALDTYVSGATYAARFRNSGDDVARHGITIVAGKDDGSTASETAYLVARNGADDGTVGSLGHQTGGDFVCNTTSDARLKENIIDTKIDGLDVINAVKVREFIWKERNGGIKNVAGLIAQELKEVWPKAVSGKEDEFEEDGAIKYMSVANACLIEPMLKAIQELSAKVEALENNNEQTGDSNNGESNQGSSNSGSSTR